ncbi:MAG: metallophosphoesterase [Clostridia bacterium]|nr:metallophosphoesterase [Clostridia bacterium]
MKKSRLLRRIWLLALFLGCVYAALSYEPAIPSSASPSPLAAFSQNGINAEKIYIPAPQVTATPTALTLAPTPTPTPQPTPFCICHISDTQYYAYKIPEIFRTMTRYLVDSKEEFNILFAVHTGDVIDNRHYERHWTNAKSAIDILEGELPLYCIAGNHDVGADTADYTAFNSYGFNFAKDASKQYEGGECWYETFNAGGTDFLLLGIGWQVNTDYLPWCASVLAAHPNHVAIILVHSFLSDDGSLTTNGKRIESALIEPYPNVRLVLCGHNDGSVRIQLEYKGRTVNALMYNFQDDTENGLGYLRLLMFNPVTRKIAVTTYSPYLDDYNYCSDGTLDTFTLVDAF